MRRFLRVFLALIIANITPYQVYATPSSIVDETHALARKAARALLLTSIGEFVGESNNIQKINNEILLNTIAEAQEKQRLALVKFHNEYYEKTQDNEIFDSAHHLRNLIDQLEEPLIEAQKNWIQYRQLTNQYLDASQRYLYQLRQGVNKLENLCRDGIAMSLSRGGRDFNPIANRIFNPNDFSLSFNMNFGFEGGSNFLVDFESHRSGDDLRLLSDIFKTGASAFAQSEPQAYGNEKNNDDGKAILRTLLIVLLVFDILFTWEKVKKHNREVRKHAAEADYLAKNIAGADDVKRYFIEQCSEILPEFESLSDILNDIENSPEKAQKLEDLKASLEEDRKEIQDYLEVFDQKLKSYESQSHILNQLPPDATEEQKNQALKAFNESEAVREFKDFFEDQLGSKELALVLSYTTKNLYLNSVSKIEENIANDEKYFARAFFEEQFEKISNLRSLLFRLNLKERAPDFLQQLQYEMDNAEVIKKLYDDWDSIAVYIITSHFSLGTNQVLDVDVEMWTSSVEELYDDHPFSPLTSALFENLQSLRLYIANSGSTL